MKYLFKREPRPYQRDTMKDIYRMKRFGVFFEPGTGKTQIALDFLGVMFLNKKVGRALIVSPLSVLSVWQDEIIKLWDESTSPSYVIVRPKMKEDWKKAQVVLVNYDYMKLITKELSVWGPDVVILDESHKIKNPHTKTSKAAHILGNICRYAVALTGTPIGNRPLDLWSQFKFLVPGLLEPKFKDFKEKYSIWGGAGGFELKKYKNLAELGKIIAPYVRSLKKKEYLDLPEKNFVEISVEMGEEARKLYESMEKDFVATVAKETVVNAPIVLSKLMKLSQISGGFIRHTEEEKDYPVHRAKLEVLRGITDDLLAAEVKRVVIFCRFIWEIEEIKKLLAPDWVTFEVSGRVKKEEERKLAQSLFNESGGAMICQISSGSLGLNLQAANYMVFYSVDYSHINFLQAQDRIHRSGQSLPCFYYMLLCKATLDRRIYRILKGKRDIAESMIELVKEAQRKKS